MTGRAASGGPEGGGAPSIGAYLARQRQLRGISLEELEAETRIPRRSLARLEAGAFDGHSDAFARGFVRAVAGALGLDAEEAMLRLLQQPPAAEGAGRPMGLRARLLLGGALAAGLLLGLFLLLRAADPAALGRVARRLFLGGPVEVVPRPDVVRALLPEAERRARLAPPPPAPREAPAPAAEAAPAPAEGPETPVAPPAEAAAPAPAAETPGEPPPLR